MPLLLSFTYISFQSLISSFYPEVNEVVWRAKEEITLVTFLHNWRYVKFEDAAHDSLTCCSLSLLFYMATSIKYNTFLLQFLWSWHASFSFSLILLFFIFHWLKNLDDMVFVIYE
jgi:hypothetical protein